DGEFSLRQSPLFLSLTRPISAPHLIHPTVSMSTRQTRRQAAQASQTGAAVTGVDIHDPVLPKKDQAASPNGALMNGNGSTHRAPARSDETEKENIFLFWPN